MMGAKARESKTEQRKQAEHKSFAGYIVKADPAQGIIDAVVNVFGIVDLGDDVIHNGAYTKTLNERGNQVRVRVLDNHNTDSILRVIGKPIEIREIGRDELALIAPDVLRKHPTATGGLFTRTQFLMDTPEGEGAYKRLASGAVDEWSIALDALDVDFGKVMIEGKERVVRNLRQIRLYEYSPVIWGMNQATTTTDVKATDAPARNEGEQGVPVPDEESEPDKSASPAATQKTATIATRLEASMRMGAAYCIVDWLGMGMIDGATVEMLNGAVETGMTALRTALPAAVGDMPLHEMYAARGGDDAKAGRMISDANRTKIQAAIDALQALMDASAPAGADQEMNAIPESTVDKTLTGSGADVVPATPSIPATDAKIVPLDAEMIDRELSELNLMMELPA